MPKKPLRAERFREPMTEVVAEDLGRGGHEGFPAEPGLPFSALRSNSREVEPPPGPALRLKLAAIAALVTRAVRDEADAIPALHAALGGWRN